jgi:signal peptide peptidase SppA
MSAVPARLIDTALMVHPDRALEILRAIQGDVISIIDTPKKIAMSGFSDGIEYLDDGYAIVNGVGIIDISGGLIYKGYGWFWETSYLDIRRAFQSALADPAVKSILFDIDSPGGEVAGVFDLVDEIYSARGYKPIVAMANEDAFSAAYAIASAADEVYLTRTAQVGSIGVIAIHADQSGYDAQLGVKYTAIYAGERKNDFNPHEPLNDLARESIQAHINTIYDLFTTTVARNRGIDQNVIKDTQAAIFSGGDAVRMGLADGVKTFEQVYQGLSKLAKGGFFMGIDQIKEAIVAEKPENIEKMMADIGFMPVSGMPDIEKIKAEAMEAGRIEGARQAIMQATEIVELCELAGTMNLAGSLLGSSIQEAKKMILEEKAKQDSAHVIKSTVGPIGADDVNALIEDAKRRAGVNK